MAAKSLLVLASALFVQSALGQCGCGGQGYAGTWSGRLGCGGAELAAAYGGGLDVSSGSGIPPSGLAVESENAYEGCVEVVGNFPFLGTTHVEGVFPTHGAGAIKYGCGDGAVAITAESPISATYAPSFGLGYEAGPGYGLGLEAGLGYKGYGLGGCGCGRI